MDHLDHLNAAVGRANRAGIDLVKKLKAAVGKRGRVSFVAGDELSDPCVTVIAKTSGWVWSIQITTVGGIEYLVDEGKVKQPIHKHKSVLNTKSANKVVAYFARA